MSTKTEISYSFLLEHLMTWAKDKYWNGISTYVPAEMGEDIELDEEEMYEHTGLMREAFFKEYIYPYKRLLENKKLTPKAIDYILEQQSSIVGYYYLSCLLKQDTLKFTTVNVYHFYQDKLDWVISHVRDLALPGLFDNISDYLDNLDLAYNAANVYNDAIIPYKQCHYCGKLDYFITNKGKEKFNKKTKCCHAKVCTLTSEPNPKEHVELGCCFGYWAKDKKHFRQTLDRHSAHYNENTKLILTTKGNEEKQALVEEVIKTKKLIICLFLEKLEFYYNLEKENPIRIK